MVVEGELAVAGVGCAGGLIAELLHWWNLREAEQLPAYRASLFYWTSAGMILAGGFIAWLYFGGVPKALLLSMSASLLHSSFKSL